MSTLSDLVLAQGRSSEADVEWLHLLVGDWQLLADLSFADMVLWVPTADGSSFVAVAHARPSSAATLFYRDIVGQEIREEWRDQVTQSFTGSRVVDSAEPDWYEDTPTRVRAIPVLRRLTAKSAETTERPIAVVTRHSNQDESRTPSRQELNFTASANDLFGMIATGDFPDLGAPAGPRRGAPRASDGLLRLDTNGVVTFASPNGLSAFNRMGFDGELERKSLAEVTTELLGAQLDVDESLPLVVTGRAPWRADIEAKGVTVTLRSIPLRDHGERIGAVVLCRDVTEMRHQEREPHHQGRDDPRDPPPGQEQPADGRLTAADPGAPHPLRRGADLAAERDATRGRDRRRARHPVDGPQSDRGLRRGVRLGPQARDRGRRVAQHDRAPEEDGEFGVLPSEAATPLALGLTELVTNAVEHGLDGRDGEVEIVANRHDDHIEIQVRDNGVGLPEGKVGSGLGTQIVRTLIQGELGGTIDWHTLTGSGTEVTISIPFRWLTAGTAA